MSEVFFKELLIPEPDINLEVGSGSHSRQTGEMLYKIEEVLLQQKPDCVMVYGDTNSTLAGALAASKLNIPVAHVEAGLRSFNKKMAEEQNRVLTDHLASLLFCPTEVAQENLRKEGIRKGVEVVGDVMYDASLFYRNMLAEQRSVPSDKFYLLTLHRAENTDNPERLAAIVEALNSLDNFKGVFPIHPRTRKALTKQGLELKPHVKLIEPVGFLEMLCLEEACEFIVTDSGGLQKEAYFFAKPCITLRDQTEWVETVKAGWNVIVGADKEKILNAFNDLKSNSRPAYSPSFYGNGLAGTKIVEKIINT
jgi:UDP-GlcNAc3NAcA epimerase